MIAAAKKNGVKLMVAYRLHFDKANLRAVETVKSGKLGAPRIFNLRSLCRYERTIFVSKLSWAERPLWDIGIYCINAARYLFRAEPEEVFAFDATSKDARFEEVEESVSAVLKFPGARLAAFSCSFGASDVSCYDIVGTKGSLRAEPAYEYAEGLKLRVTIDGKMKEHEFGKSDQFGPELLYFSDCILHKREPEPDGEHGLADVRIIHALYESLESGKTVPLQIADTSKPEKRQEIRRPPVQKPELVHAHSSSAN